MTIPEAIHHARDAATAYLRAGLSVLPAILDQKRPALQSWRRYTERLPTEDEVRAWFRPDTPVCVVTGGVSGHLEMIDFDLGGEAYEGWASRVETHAPGLVGRLYLERSRRGGLHAVYRCLTPVSGNLKLARRAGRDGETVTLIETRGEGGLFLCAPTAGYETIKGGLCDLPVITADERDVLLRCAREIDRSGVPAIVEPHHPISPDRSVLRPGDDYNARGDVREILRSHGWVLSKGGENEHWRRPGKDHGTSATLKDGVFYVFSSNAPPFEPGHAYAPFAVYAMLEHGGDYSAAAAALRVAGYGGDDVGGEERGGVDLSEFRPLMPDVPFKKRNKSVRRTDPGPFPPHLLRVPGFVARVMEHNLATSHRPQPVLALCGALCLQALLAARKVRDRRGNRTNIYSVGIAPSGSGKEHARKVNKRILYAAGIEHMEGPEDLASDSGLFSSVEAQPAIMFQLDEFGRFLRTIGDPKKAPHLYNVIGVLMRLYSSADNIFKGKAYANRKLNKVIDQPCVVLHGTTVPEHFFLSLTPESMSDGFLGRVLIFESRDIPDRQCPRDAEPPEDIVAAARWWSTLHTGGNLRSEHPEPILVGNTDEAQSVFGRLADSVDREMRSSPAAASVWARAEEKACRLALIYACSEDAGSPIIDAEAASWGCEVAEYMTRRMIDLADEWVADGKFDQQQKRAIRIIRDAGGTIDRSDLCRRTQWLTQRERNEVVQNLIETGAIEVAYMEPGSSGGRSAMVYRLA